MLTTDPIVQKYPQYLPTEDEVDATLKLLQKPEHAELKKALEEHISIGGCVRSSARRFCWQARQDGKTGEQCAVGALEWLTMCVTARTSLRIDTLLRQGPFTAAFRDLYFTAMPFSFHGVDRQGHPVMIARYGSVDIEALRRLWSEGEALQQSANLAVNAAVIFHIRAMEYMTQIVMAKESKRQGQIVDRILGIIDVGGLGMKHVNSPLKTFLGAVAKQSNPLFPETMFMTVMANAPWLVARAAWPIARGFLHPVTQDKIVMLSGAAEVKKKLEELIDLKDVPPYFGGSCSCSECLAGHPQGGSLRTWEDEEGIYTGVPKRPSTPPTTDKDTTPADSADSAETDAAGSPTPIASPFGAAAPGAAAAAAATNGEKRQPEQREGCAPCSRFLSRFGCDTPAIAADDLCCGAGLIGKSKGDKATVPAH